MSKGIKPGELGRTISDALTLYSEDVKTKVNRLGKEAMSELVRITKDTAPYNEKAHHRHYVDCIASKTEKSRIGDDTHIWYVKAPCHRLTHLLVDGHKTVLGSGKRRKEGGKAQTSKNNFLRDACDRVLPEYEQNVEDVIKHG